MKKFLLLILTFIVSISLVVCGDKNKPLYTPTTNTNEVLKFQNEEELYNYLQTYDENTNCYLEYEFSFSVNGMKCDATLVSEVDGFKSHSIMFMEMKYDGNTIKQKMENWTNITETELVIITRMDMLGEEYWSENSIPYDKDIIEQECLDSLNTSIAYIKETIENHVSGKVVSSIVKQSSDGSYYYVSFNEYVDSSLSGDLIVKYYPTTNNFEYAIDGKLVYEGCNVTVNEDNLSVKFDIYTFLSETSSSVTTDFAEGVAFDQFTYANGKYELNDGIEAKLGIEEYSLKFNKDLTKMNFTCVMNKIPGMEEYGEMNITVKGTYKLCGKIVINLPEVPEQE